MECPNQMQLDHTKQLATMQNEIENMKVSISDFSGIKDNLLKLTFLNEQVLDFNKKQSEANKEFKTTLTNIDKNLTNLNTRMKAVEEKDIQEEVSATELRVKEEETRSEKFKAKFTFYGVIAAGVLALIGILVPLAFR